MASTVKKLIKKLFKNFGYDVIYTGKETGNFIGGPGRPVGRMNLLLEDMKARGLAGRNILDVGANRGIWSRLAKQVFPDANCFLIEPLTETRDDLGQFCRDFPGSKILPYGAAAEKGQLTFTIWDDLQGSSFIPSENNNLLKTGKQRVVDVITIDELIQSNQITVPDLMKLDVQGFELEALKGAKQTFGKTEAYILEVSLFQFDPKTPVIGDVIAFMNERDYVVYDFPGFLRRPFDGALGQCDICFVKKNGLLRKSNAWD